MKYQVLKSCNIDGEMIAQGSEIEASEKKVAPLVKSGALKAVGKVVKKAPAKKAPPKKRK